MKKLITLLVCISCIYMIAQPFRLLFEGGQALSMLVPTVLIMLTDNLFANRSIIMAVIYTAIVFILVSIGVEYFESYISQIVSMFFSICCIEHYIKTKDDSFAKTVLITYLACFVVMAIISIPQFYLYPEMTRQLLFAEHEGTRVSSQFYWSLAYSSMHEVPFLLIPLIVSYKFSSKKLIRILILISISVLFIAIMLGDVTTSLLLSVVILFVLFIYKPYRPMSYNLTRLFVIMGLLIFLFNKVIMVSVLSTIQPVFEGTTNYTKIEDAKWQIQTGEVTEGSNLGNREIAYNRSEDAFWSHPFGIEMKNDNIGMHSFIRDHLAALGLILIIPLVILVYWRYILIAKRLSRFKYYFIVTYLALIAMAFYKNFFLKIDAWFIVPMFLLMFEQKYKKNEHIKFTVTENQKLS